MTPEELRDAVTLKQKSIYVLHTNVQVLIERYIYDVDAEGMEHSVCHIRIFQSVNNEEFRIIVRLAGNLEQLNNSFMGSTEIKAVIDGKYLSTVPYGTEAAKALYSE